MSQTQDAEKTIHIKWDGPLTLKDVESLKGPTDYGLYQIYGPDPTYRRVGLLYIGLAGLSPNSTFGERIPKNDHKCYWGNGDHESVRVYVGRLMGLQTPEN